MPNDKLEKLKKLLEITNEGLTRKEFIESFKRVVNQILKMEADLIKKIDFKTAEEKKQLTELKEEFNKVIADAKSESDTTFGGFKRKSLEAINKLFTRNEVNKKLQEQRKKTDEKITEMNEVILEAIDKIALVRDGVDGTNADPVDEEEIIKKLLKQIIVPDHKKELKELEERVMEEIRRHKFVKGGGTSAMGIANAAKYFVKTEAPVGAINGSNKAYTVNHVIFAVLSFSLNGEVVAQLPNYSISNKTITFSSALSADYSGKDFEIVYI